MAVINNKTKVSKPFWLKVLMLLRPGDGQLHGNRRDLHLLCAQRDICDPQMWTHAFLFIAALVAGFNGLNDLCTLLTITAPLSTMYHLDFEKPGFIAKMEGFIAKVTFVYGIIQMFLAPTMLLFICEFAILVIILIIFIGTNVCKEYYEPWHCLMHVVPAVWAVLVSFTHTPLISF